MIRKDTPKNEEWFKDALTTGTFGFVCEKDILTKLELTPEKIMETDYLIPFVVVNNTCVLANGGGISVNEAVEDLIKVESDFFDGYFYLNNVVTNKYIITHIINIPKDLDFSSFYYIRTYLRDYYRYPNDEYYHRIVPYVNPALKKSVTMQELKEHLGFNFFIVQT